MSLRTLNQCDKSRIPAFRINLPMWDGVWRMNILLSENNVQKHEVKNTNIKHSQVGGIIWSLNSSRHGLDIYHIPACTELGTKWIINCFKHCIFSLVHNPRKNVKKIKEHSINFHQVHINTIRSLQRQSIPESFITTF